jgi:hypothetical protein
MPLLATASGPAEREQLAQILAISPRPDSEQHCPAEHRKGSKAPRVAADQRRRHPDDSKADQGFPGAISLRTLAAPAFPRLRESLWKLGIEHKAQAKDAHDHAKKER